MVYLDMMIQHYILLHMHLLQQRHYQSIIFYAEIERYYYDKELGVILNSDGKKLRNRYDDNIVFHSIR